MTDYIDFLLSICNYALFCLHLCGLYYILLFNFVPYNEFIINIIIIHIHTKEIYRKHVPFTFCVWCMGMHFTMTRILHKITIFVSCFFVPLFRFCFYFVYVMPLKKIHKWACKMMPQNLPRFPLNAVPKSLSIQKKEG